MVAHCSALWVGIERNGFFFTCTHDIKVAFFTQKKLYMCVCVCVCMCVWGGGERGPWCGGAPSGPATTESGTVPLSIRRDDSNQSKLKLQRDITLMTRLATETPTHTSFISTQTRLRRQCTKLVVCAIHNVHPFDYGSFLLQRANWGSTFLSTSTTQVSNVHDHVNPSNYCTPWKQQ